MTFYGALQVALPEVFLAISALVLLVFGAVSGKGGPKLVSILAAAALLVAAGLAAVGPLGSAFSGGLVADQASAFAKVAIYAMSSVAVFLGAGWLERLKARQFEYPVLIILAAIGMGMMASSGDLISLYVGVELQSLALYVLAAFRRDDAKASEAGLKYFVLGALSSGLLLYGASLIYGFAGSVKFADIALAVHAGAGHGVLFGLVFLICGLAFKVSAAPFHMWTPDVYEGAPTPVVAFFAAAPKLAAMVLFARALGFPPFSGFWGKFYVFKAILQAGYVEHTMSVGLAVSVAAIGLVSSVVAAFYYLRLIKVMWFDPAPGAVDAPPADAKGVAYAAALFSFPVVLIALIYLDPAAHLAASAFGLS